MRPSSYAVGALLATALVALAGCGGSGSHTSQTAAHHHTSTSPDATSSTPAGLPRAPAATPATVTVPVTGSLKIDHENYGEIATGLGAIWVADGHGHLVKVDPAATKMVWSKQVPGGQNLAVGFGSVWVIDSVHALVRRIDPQTGAVVATMKTGENPEGVIAGGQSIWVSNQRGGSVTRIDPSSNAVVDTVSGLGSPGDHGPQLMAADRRHVYTGVADPQSVFSVDVTSGQTHEFSIAPDGASPGPLTLDGPVVWVSGGYDQGDLTRIDTSTGRALITQEIRGSYGNGIVRGDVVWFTSYDENADRGSLMALDRQTGAQVMTAASPEVFADGVVADGSWWVLGRKGLLLRFKLSDLPTHA